MHSELINNLSLGLTTALTLTNLFYCFLGVTFGMLIGVLPGIGALAAIALLLPITFHLEPTSALVMLAGVFYGACYGGSTASILLNLPGEPSSAVVCLDGHPMARQGRAGVALFMVTIASFIGGSIGILLMMIFSGMIVDIALEFGPPEYFSLMLFGLVAASSISSGDPVKAIAMVVAGGILGIVGADVQTGVQRFTFSIPSLYDGVSLTALAMGLFGVTEVIASVRDTKRGAVSHKEITIRSMIPSRDDVQRSWAPIFRGSAIGAFFGALPGTGGVIASFMSYAVEKKLAKDPSRFGKGAIEGVVSPEASNNAAAQCAFIPTLTLGIPGSVVMAMMIGALMIHGIAPGPQLLAKEPALFWGLIMSFWIGNLMLLILNIPLIGIWVRLLVVPYHILYPAILMFVCLGVYSINNNAFDVFLVVIFGALGYAMLLFGFHPAPLLLGYILAPMMEENFGRSLVLSRGSFMTFVERPISAACLAATALLLTWTISSALRAGRARATGIPELD